MQHQLTTAISDVTELQAVNDAGAKEEGEELKVRISVAASSQTTGRH